MKYKLLLTALLVLMILPIISASDSNIFTVGDNVTISSLCLNQSGSVCDGSCSVNLSLWNPSKSIYLSNQSMIFEANGYFNYTITGLSNTGEWYGDIICSSGTDLGETYFTFTLQNQPTTQTNTVYAGGGVTGMTAADIQSIESKSKLFDTKYSWAIGVSVLALVISFIAWRKKGKMLVIDAGELEE